MSESNLPGPPRPAQAARKGMSVFWSIIAVREEFLGGRRPVLLGRMWLLDNGPRGCTASAKALGSYTGLSPRTVEKYRIELADLGLLYQVAGTSGWHVSLPPGPPPPHATTAEIQAYARRIEAQLGPEKTTPPGVDATAETTTP